MYKILAIVGSEVVNGFILAGIEAVHVKSKEEAKQTLMDNLSKNKYGIIIIEEALYEGLDLHLRKTIDKGSLPLVVPLPMEMKWKEGDFSTKSDYIARLIRRIIGYNVKIS